MRIYGPNGTGSVSPTPSARRSSSTSSFSLDDISLAPEARPTVAPRTPAGIDTLLALQGIEDPTERRRRSVAKGRTALDVLDELKIGLLAGALDTGTLTRLRMAASDLKLSSGDPGLDQVLSEIELRVEVELAKVGQ